MKLAQAHGHLMALVQVVFIVLFCIFARYHPDANARYHPLYNATESETKLNHYTSDDAWAHSKTFPMFQDVHVMIFLGIGFLIMFLKRYGLSGVGFNFMLGALSVQWALLVNGFFHLEHGNILISLNSLVAADFTTATVLISFGVVLGKTTPIQLVIMTLFEVPFFVVNEVIGRRVFGAIDIGDSMFVHVFAAYFGLAVSLVLYRREVSNDKEGSSNMSDKFSMIGTIFLWCYWPSFNGAAAPADDQHRAIINTYISLTTCCLSTFAMSVLLHNERKFNMVHVQNSTLAGGVAIGTAADLMVEPWGAVVIGVLAAIVSVLGFSYVTPFMSSHLRLHDTCGVHSLHGLPGLLAAIIGCIVAALASEETYGPSLYKIFPGRAPEEGDDRLQELRLLFGSEGLDAGQGVTAAGQAVSQLLALVVTIAISIAGGLVTGLVLRLPVFNILKTNELYEDSKYWILEEGEEEEEGHKGGAVSLAMADNGTSK